MNQLKIRYWTRKPKLVCHKCGCYYARTFNNNKEIWKSLCTAHFSVAKVRLAEFQRIKTVGRVVGLYGVIAYSVSQRTREIGIRIARGAQQNNVMRLILGEGMLVILIGLAGS